MIVLHPEGTVTRDPDGWPMVGKTGAARLALLAPDIPVIPVAQWGVQEQIDLYRKKVKPDPAAAARALGRRPDRPVGVPRPARPTRRRCAQVTEVIMRRLRADVAELRGVPAPNGAAVQVDAAASNEQAG